MALLVFEKNFLYRAYLFAWLKKMAPIKSESKVQKPLRFSGRLDGIFPPLFLCFINFTVATPFSLGESNYKGLNYSYQRA
jgi:hypothetical protein